MEKEFDILSAKLDAIKGSMVEIENFARKQSELFEVLSRKFPNIEQFTNALKEAHELQEHTKRLEAEANICVRTVSILSARLNSEKNALKEKQKIIHILIETLSKVDGMDETTLNNLKKLISSFK
jgi:chromosome segregation ATPase